MLTMIYSLTREIEKIRELEILASWQGRQFRTQKKDYFYEFTLFFAS